LLQLRDKDLGSRALFDLGRQMRRLCDQWQALLIINDRLDMALAVKADGVHLGDQDLPIAIARRLLGPQAIIGASVRTAEEAQRAQAAGASYLGVGPVYATMSKTDAGTAIGLRPIAEIGADVSIPALAIGGISHDNVGEVIRAGAAGVAVISAVSEARDMVTATAELLEAVRAAHQIPSGAKT
jgi:thiamine-phosphate pyrophosphorylase